MTNTIFAPITGRGGAVVVVRASGADAFAILAPLAGGVPPARRAVLRRLRDRTGAVLDHALVAAFPGPNSFTGEDSFELSLHGGRAVLAAVSAALIAQGARPAEPGEFSRRAFDNARLDLLGAEAMADLIAAETEAQRQAAIDGGAGLGAAARAWRGELVGIMALEEALIDFPDEDLPPQTQHEARARIARLRGEIATALQEGGRAARLREGLEFVILGAPNTGKSSLLNALAGDDIAIVSDIPGTTRDAIGVRVDFGGVPVHLTDTAGLRESTDAIEAEGVRRAGAKARAADLVLLIGAAPDFVAPDPPPGVEHLHIATKIDLGGAIPAGALGVCAQSGAGIAELTRKLVAIARRMTDTAGAPALTRPRHIACLTETLAALDAALVAEEAELRAEELRQAALALGRLTGAIGVEEILDLVFGQFCIGK